MKLGLPFSVSLIFWFFVGLLRFVSEELFSNPKRAKKTEIEAKIAKVAVCLPAHNEEVVILKTIKNLKKIIPVRQVYVVSDGSKDRTASIARSQGCNVLELSSGKGKAGALVSLMKHFRLLSRFEFILFVDADTIIDKNYLKRAIGVFADDPRVAAIAGYAISVWRKHKGLERGKFFVAYRVRLYRLLQLFLMYGQSWKYINVNPVIPGFASIYRAVVLKKIKIDTPGLLIEDFNLAFQIHKKKLGKIAHYPTISAYDQDPDNFSDYWNQVRRWNIGFFQTVRKHGIWPSFLWLSLGFFVFEVVLVSLFFALLPLFVLVMAIPESALAFSPQLAQALQPVKSYIPLWQIFFVFVILDYALTLLVAINDKKAKLVVYGLGFVFFQYINSLILLLSLPEGLLTKSGGRWVPPKRR